MFNALKVAVVLTAIDKMSKVVGGAVDTSQKHLTRFSKEANKISDQAFNIGRQAGMFGLAVGVPLFKAAEAAEQSEQATRKLEQVFKSMGETSGKAAIQAQKFASSLMLEIAVDDEKILAVQTKLATFEKVIKNTAGTSEIFERATRAAFDLEAAGFGEGSQNAVQLGKALQDPIKGINSLARSGVTFTATEKKKIQALVESGQQLKAQKILLDAVEKQVGGVAKANVTSTAKIKIAFGEVVEKIGTALLPMLERFSKWIDKTLPKIQKWFDENQQLVQTIAEIAAIVAVASLAISGIAFVVGGVIKVFGFLSSAINFTISAFKFMGTAIRVVSAFMMANPIIAIITGIAIAATLIYVYWDNIKKFFIDLWDNVKKIFWKVVDWMKKWGFLFSWPIWLIYKYWAEIKTFFIKLWDDTKKVFWKVVAWIKEWGILFIGPIGFIIKYWNEIVTFFGEMWKKVKEKFLKFLDWMMAFPKRLYKVGEAIVDNIWDGMKAKWNDMMKWFKDGLQDMRNMLPFSPAKTGPLRDIHKLKFVETIAANIKPGPMVNAMDKALSATKGVVKSGGKGMTPSSAPSVGGGSSSVVVNFAPVFNGGTASAGGKQDFIAQLKEYEPQLMRVINDALARKERKKFA
jgi:hypothetical protein